MLLYRLVILLSLVTLLSSSSFFINSYLEQRIERGESSKAEQQLALTLGLPAAYRLELHNYAVGSGPWLNYASRLGRTQGDMALTLAGYYQQQHNEHQAELWYQEAMRLHAAKALPDLASFYLGLQQPDKAWQLLQSAELNDDALLLQIRLALRLGRLDVIVQQRQKLTQFMAGQQLLAQLKHFRVFAERSSVVAEPADSLAAMAEVPAGNDCDKKVQFFASNLADLNYAEQLIAKVQPQGVGQAFCFATPRYRALATLQCQGNGDSTIHCNEAQWQAIAGTIDARYLAVLLPDGGANVHLGILYLARQDNVQVLLHELSHLVGFIDEYPLPARHSFCEQAQQQSLALNIMVPAHHYSPEQRRQLLAQIPWRKYIKAGTPLFHQDNGQWQLGTPASYHNEVGLFASATCDNQQLPAFKPVATSTRLSHFEHRMPPLYLKLLADEGRRFAMPSFYYNLALATADGGKNELAKGWLNKALSLEREPERRQRLLDGAF